MIASIYDFLIPYEEVGGDMVARLRSINCVEIFQPIITKYREDQSEFNKVLFYILYCYTQKSKFHIVGISWFLVKRNAAKRLSIEENSVLFKETVLLEDEDVLKAIQNYVDFNGSRNFAHLITLKDLHMQMERSAVTQIKKGEVVDYAQKLRNMKYAAELLEEIKAFETRIAEEDKELKEAQEELREKKKDTTRSIRLEDNLQ